MSAAISYRPATIADLEMLLAWRNDPLTRINSRDSGLVGREDHRRWLMASLANPNGQLLIAEHDGVAIGTVRLDFSGDRCELSWTVAPEARGRGLGSLMVAGAVPAAGGKNVVAEIKRGNSASIRIAAKAGFRFFEERDGLQVWRR